MALSDFYPGVVAFALVTVKSDDDFTRDVFRDLQFDRTRIASRLRREIQVHFYYRIRVQAVRWLGCLPKHICVDEVGCDLFPSYFRRCTVLSLDILQDLDQVVSIICD